MTMLIPGDVGELAAMIGAATESGRRLEIGAGGSKAAIGAARPGAEPLSMAGFSGIVDYDPAELTLTARAATPLAEVEALVASEGQMLAFEPFDHGPLFGEAAGLATIGGVVAAGVSGSRRVSAGAARDHLLRVEAVSGRGEAFVAGARVVKNVTGYDLPKLMCGSWGRLAALTEVTLKVLPRPPASTTLVWPDLAPEAASRAMLAAMGSTAAVSAAAHLPGLWGHGAITALRLEGVAPSIEARIETLSALALAPAPFDLLDAARADELWDGLRTCAPLGGALPLWRVHLPAKAWPALVAAMAPFEGRWMVDWAGSLVWLASAAPGEAIRAAAGAAGGHAMLVRGGAEGGDVLVFHPPPAPVAALEARLRRAFDPRRVFETGRFGVDDAD